MNKPDSDVADPWAQHERSQALYFRSLSLQEKMEAVEAMADLVRQGAREVDLAPMVHVADAMTLGRRIVTDPFDW